MCSIRVNHAAFDIDVIADVIGGSATDVELAVSISGSVAISVAFTFASTRGDASTCTLATACRGITANSRT